MDSLTLVTRHTSSRRRRVGASLLLLTIPLSACQLRLENDCPPAPEPGINAFWQSQTRELVKQLGDSTKDLKLAEPVRNSLTALESSLQKDLAVKAQSTPEATPVATLRVQNEKDLCPLLVRGADLFSQAGKQSTSPLLVIRYQLAQWKIELAAQQVCSTLKLPVPDLAATGGPLGQLGNPDPRSAECQKSHPMANPQAPAEAASGLTPEVTASPATSATPENTKQLPGLPRAEETDTKMPVSAESTPKWVDDQNKFPALPAMDTDAKADFLAKHKAYTQLESLFAQDPQLRLDEGALPANPKEKEAAVAKYRARRAQLQQLLDLLTQDMAQGRAGLEIGTLPVVYPAPAPLATTEGVRGQEAQVLSGLLGRYLYEYASASAAARPVALEKAKVVKSVAELLGVWPAVLNAQ
ncbi:hypothetical protein [Boudabousia liubingyangii]|nr:hypothetical protein [Boudabousia liubingyangii]